MGGRRPVRAETRRAPEPVARRDEDLAAMVRICRESGCDEYTDQVELGAWPGRCDWIARRARRSCAACFVDNLRRKDLPPAEICALRRAVETVFDRGSKRVLISI